MGVDVPSRFRHNLFWLPLAAGFLFASPKSVVGNAPQEIAGREQCLSAPTAACLFTEAERIALSIPIDFGYWRIRALTGIAEAYGNTHLESIAPRADVIVLFARAETLGLEGGMQEGAWVVIARAQARLGNIDEALASAGRIDNVDTRYHAISGIAAAQAEDGDVVGALLTASGIDDADSHFVALALIAEAQARLGDSRGALQTARSAGAPWRDIALLTVARTLASGGYVPEALEAAVEIEDESRRQYVAVLTTVEAGNLESGVQTATGIANPALRESAFTAIAAATAKRGDLAEALRIANTLEDSSDRSNALADIATAQAAAGDTDGALRTLRTIKDHLSRMTADTPLDSMKRVDAIQVELSMEAAATSVAVEQASTSDPSDAVFTASEFLRGDALAIGLARVAAEIAKRQ